MKEKDIYQKMKKEFKNTKIFLQPIESGSTSSGIPDIYYCKINSSGWIELKVLNRYPKNDIVNIPFRAGQIGWIRKFRYISNNIFLFLYIENSLWICRGNRILENYSQSELIKFTNYKALWNEVDWEFVFKLL